MANQGFDINKIKIKESNKIKALTGEYTFGLPPASTTEPNAEVEDNEYIKYPDESIVQAKGVRHERGGIKVNLPNETEILSDTLKLTAKQAKEIRAKYNIEVSIRDTYSSALEKYTKRLGLKRLNDDQEEIFKLVKKQQDNKTIKDSTLKINNEYLSTKVYDIEQKKKPLEEKRKQLFDLLFEQQESTKKPDSKDTTQMRYGGEFEKFANKHGFSVEEAARILAREGKTIPIFDGGGKKRKLSRETISDDEFNKADESGVTLSDRWNGDKAAYEDYLTAKKGILGNKDLRSNIYKNYQSVINSDEAYTGKNKKLKQGYSKPLSGLTEDQVLEQLLAQEERNARLAAHKLDAKSTQQNVAKGKTTNQATLEKIKATKGLQDLDFSKGYQGQAAYIAYNKTMQEDPRYKDWATIGQTGAGDETIFGLKGSISGIDNYNTNTTLGQRLGYLGEPTPECPCGEDASGQCLPCEKEEPTKEPLKEEVKTEEKPIKDEIVVPIQKQNQWFYTPERFVLPPSPQSPETMVNTRLSRLDPIRVGIEDDLASSAANRQFGASQLKDLPASQRVAGLQQMLVNTGNIENKAIIDKNRINAENQAQIDQYNAGQRDRENIALGSNLLNFEGRSLRGKDITENNLRNYINFKENEALNNFQVQQRLNTMNKLFPDYGIDSFGMGVGFQPSTTYQVQNNDDIQGLINADNQTYSNYYPNDKTTEDENDEEED